MLQIQLKLKSFDLYYLKLATNWINSVCQILDIKKYQEIPLPTHIQKFTVLSSPHIDKKSREQFELKKFKQLINLVPENEFAGFLLIGILKNSELIGIELEINVKILDYFKQN